MPETRKPRANFNSIPEEPPFFDEDENVHTNREQQIVKLMGVNAVSNSPRANTPAAVVSVEEVVKSLQTPASFQRPDSL